jgi:glucose/arabinose dehydrogenase
MRGSLWLVVHLCVLVALSVSCAFEDDADGDGDPEIVITRGTVAISDASNDDLGDVPFAQSSLLTYTIANPGGGTLTIGGVTATPGANLTTLSVTQPGTSIDPSGSDSFSVTFNVTNPGPFDFSIAVENDATNPFSWTVSGNGGTAGYPDPGPRNPLPSDFAELDYYWGAEAIATGLNTPVKMAQAPDGRLFINLLGGTILVIEPTPPYTQHTFATENVLNGAEQGLLGIALSPDFATDSYVFVMACVNDVTDQQQIIRYTDNANVGVGRTVIVNNLPTETTHNAGGIKFGTDGKLLVSVGDAANELNSQTDGVDAGRILRFNPDGSIPADNPRFSTGVNESEWCRGLRNSFGLCVHPVAGTVVATENGPNSNDELNYIVAGKNFEWGATTQIPGAQVGVRIRLWPVVIVPTGVTYHSGNNTPPGYADNLFICSYDHEVIYRFVMDGTPPVNLFSEHAFCEFNPVAQTNKPLDIIEGIDGSLYVSTFTDVWRIYRRTGP